MTAPIFISGTGTEIGKTYVSCKLVAAIQTTGLSVAAIKPIETGCDPTPSDATLLAQACGNEALATDTRFYRAFPALAPHAVELQGGEKMPPLGTLARAVHELGAASDVCLVEGAGGLFVPLRANVQETNADFARLLNARVVVVAPNKLGVLSDVIAILEAARARQLSIAAIYLNTFESHTDLSQQTNKEVLSECAGPIPIVDNIDELAKFVLRDDPYNPVV